MSELTEVTRQRGNYGFINLLNKIREGTIDENIELTLRSRYFNENSYPKHVVNILAENNPVIGTMKLN